MRQEDGFEIEDVSGTDALTIRPIGKKGPGRRVSTSVLRVEGPVLAWAHAALLPKGVVLRSTSLPQVETPSRSRRTAR